MPPRRKKKQYVWGDTPEIVAVGSGFSRQLHYAQGFDEARMFANNLASDATSVDPGQHHSQFSWGVGKFHPEAPSAPFFQARTSGQLLETIKRSHGKLPLEDLPNYKKIGAPRVPTSISHLETDFKNVAQTMPGFKGAQMYDLLVLSAKTNPPLSSALPTTPLNGPTHAESPFKTLPLPWH